MPSTRACLFLISLPLMFGLGVAPLMGQGRVVIDHPVRPPWRPTRVTTMPLVLKYQKVYAEITDGVVVTTVHQTFRNPMRTQIEGTYVFPLPDNVAVGDFSMTVGGKTLRGEVLDKETARRTYERIVRQTRDPGLLEYMNSRLYQAKIFPIPPGANLDVKLKYSYTIEESGGLGQFRHPLRSAQPGSPPVDELLVHVKIKSSQPLASVFCPSHKCDISRPNDREAVVTYEQSHVRPDRDFQLYYQRQDKQFGLSLLTHRNAGEPGYFMIRLSPRIEFSQQDVLAKDIAFVIDTSGSMSAGKLEQVKRALKFCINSLNPRDRFNIYAFSTEVRPFRDSLMPADNDLKQAAVDFTDKLQPLGGTNINQALQAALKANPRDEGRPYLCVFMTDGKPTVDVTDVGQIVKNAAAGNASGKQRVRIHVLGIGDAVNTHLLDKLAEATRGSRDYASATEDLELKLSSFYTRLANPVLSDIALTLAGLNTHDRYPLELPDLFRGGELLVLGRYDGRGNHAVKFSGVLRGDTKSITYEGEFPKINRENDFLPRLWANRKVAYLLDQIRLHGRNQELVNEVVRLAKRHGIVTPYTSSLILEDDARIAARLPAGSREGRFRRRRLRAPAQRGLADAAERVMKEERAAGRGVAPGMSGGRGPASGEQAVRASKTIQMLRSLGYLTDSGGFDREAGNKRDSWVIRHVGDKTFIFDGERWVDSTWEGKREPKKIKAFSDAYFALLKEHADAAKYLALGPRIIVVLDGVAYETEEDEKP